MSLTRRAVLGLLGGAAGAAVVGIPLLSGVRSASSTGERLTSRIALPPRFARPLRLPPVLAPTATGPDGDRYDIVQTAARVEILPGVQTPIWGYNGIFPGPTIVSTRGRTAIVNHRNELPVPVAVHLHGGHTPPEHDGFPVDVLYPDGLTAHHPMSGLVAHGRREYRYPMRQPGATLWYHDHRMDFTGPSVWRGLAGFHLVHDPAEDSLGLPGGDRDLPLMISDRSFDADGTLLYPSLDPTLLSVPGVTEPYGAGVLGDVILVNGVPWPIARVPAARHRLRLLNASNARRYRLTLDPPEPLIQIGTDGGLLPTPISHETIEIAPGQRFVVIVDFGQFRPGAQVTLRNLFDDGATGEVMRFTVTEGSPDTSRVPDRLAEDPAVPPDTPARRQLRFRHDNVRGMAGWTVNDTPFDPDRSIAEVRLGTSEIWQLTSDFHHPVHVHLNGFRVLSRGDGGPGPYDHGVKDTLDLRPGERAEILVRFDDYAGRFVLHCHNLEHEDMAMMARFDTIV